MWGDISCDSESSKQRNVSFFVLKDAERRRLLFQIKIGGETKANLLPFVSDGGRNTDSYF